MSAETPMVLCLIRASVPMTKAEVSFGRGLHVAGRMVMLIGQVWSCAYCWHRGPVWPPTDLSVREVWSLIGELEKRYCVLVSI